MIQLLWNLVRRAMVNSPQIKLNDENHLFSCFYTTETISNVNVSNTSYCYTAISCWETLGPGIHLDVTLTHTTLNVVANYTPSAPQQRRRAQQPKRCWPCLWASQIPIRSSIYSRCQNNPDPWRPHSAPCTTQRNCSHWLSTRRYPGRSDLFLQHDLHNIKQAVLWCYVEFFLILNTWPWNMRPWEGNPPNQQRASQKKKRPWNSVSNHSLFHNIYSNVHAICTIFCLESISVMQRAWMSQSPIGKWH